MKPCPFCGGEAFATYKTRDHDGLRQHWVICKKCDARTGPHNFSEADAVAAWDQRAPVAGTGSALGEAAKLRER